MSSFLDDLESKEFLGSEFLTWLWFKSETANSFNILDQTVELSIGNKLILAEDREKIICHSEQANLALAKRALKDGKRVKQAQFKIEVDSQSYSFTLDSSFLDLKSCKVPKVSLEDREDLQGAILEQIFLFKKISRILDELLLQFTKLRLSADWSSIAVEIKNWIVIDRKESEAELIYAGK